MERVLINKKQNVRQKKYQSKKYKPKLNNGGIVIIEKFCDNKLGKIEPAVILFKCITWCADGGGKQSPEDINSKETATRELQEESCNLFKFNPDILNMVPKILIEGNYSLYFVCVDNEINAEYFDDNLLLLKKNNAPRDWKETNKLHKFYISDLKNMDLTGEDILYNVPDIYGNLMNIKSLTKIGIRDGLINREIKLDCFNLIENLDFREGNNYFTYGTKCYQL